MIRAQARIHILGICRCVDNRHFRLDAVKSLERWGAGGWVGELSVFARGK